LQVANNLTAASQNIGATAVSAAGGALITAAQSGRVSRWGIQQGDVVLSINGQKVASPESLVEVMNSIATGSAISAQITRNGVSMTVGLEAVNVGGNTATTLVGQTGGAQAGRGGGRG
jgi:S1-C subfamily serine protease